MYKIMNKGDKGFSRTLMEAERLLKIVARMKYAPNWVKVKANAVLWDTKRRLRCESIYTG